MQGHGTAVRSPVEGLHCLWRPPAGRRPRCLSPPRECDVGVRRRGPGGLLRPGGMGREVTALHTAGLAAAPATGILSSPGTSSH